VRHSAPVGTGRRLPRLGFAGVGWVGRHRLAAIAGSGRASITAIADPSAASRCAAASSLGQVAVVETFDELLACDLDGVVIATPNALHAEQAVAALDRGLAVFCQKPLARTVAETRRVIDTARAANRLLGVDFCYRHTAAVRQVRESMRSGKVGDVFAADLVFHNAYGPDKAWFYDRTQSGGGCVIDLGSHMVDLALSLLDQPRIAHLESRLFARGAPWRANDPVAEDYAEIRLDLETGATARIACSWHLSAGQDAVIGATFYGTAGAAGLRNVNGSFYDFVAERMVGTSRTTLAMPPDDWGGRAAVAWVRQLARDPGYDAAVEEVLPVASVIDEVYGR